jgi:hypothetical protein
MVVGVLARFEGVLSLVGVFACGSAGSKAVSADTSSMLKPQAVQFVAKSANSTEHRGQSAISIYVNQGVSIFLAQTAYHASARRGHCPKYRGIIRQKNIPGYAINASPSMKISAMQSSTAVTTRPFFISVFIWFVDYLPVAASSSALFASNGPFQSLRHSILENGRRYCKKCHAFVTNSKKEPVRLFLSP